VSECRGVDSALQQQCIQRGFVSAPTQPRPMFGRGFLPARRRLSNPMGAKKTTPADGDPRDPIPRGQNGLRQRCAPAAAEGRR
jgi:hypothetical protein